MDKEKQKQIEKDKKERKEEEEIQSKEIQPKGGILLLICAIYILNLRPILKIGDRDKI